MDYYNHKLKVIINNTKKRIWVFFFIFHGNAHLRIEDLQCSAQRKTKIKLCKRKKVITNNVLHF